MDKNSYDDLLKSSLSNLSSVLSSSSEFEIPMDGPELLQACKIIGQTIDVEFKAPASDKQDIESICAASGIRYRKVLLEKKWELGHGSLLGFWEESHRPLALIRRGNHYVAIDPAANKVMPLNDNLKSQLSSIAYTFYRSLPEESLGLSQIFRLCSKGIFHDYLMLFLVGMLAAVLGFFFPIANKVLFDNVIPEFNIPLYIQVMIGLTLATMGAAFFFYMRSMILLHLDGIVQNRLQMGLWDRLLKLPLWFFRKFTTGDLIQRTFVVEAIRRNLSDNTLRILLNSFFGLTYLIVMLIYSWQLALVGILVAFLGTVFSLIIFSIKLYYQRKILASNAAINSFLVQAINAISKVRMAMAENRIFGQWSREFFNNQRLKLKAQALQVREMTFNSFLGLLSYVFLFGVVIWMNQSALSGNSEDAAKEFISIGTFLAFNAAFIPFTQSLFGLTETMISIIEIIPFWERTRVIFTTPVEKTKDKVDPGELQGNILIENLYFRYDKNSAFVLHNFSMKAKQGEFIGIVGPSGCGKSTLCRILIGFEVAEKGVVLYDSKDLYGLDVYRVRNQIGVVLQGNAIFAGTVKENICCGKPFSKERIEEAAQLTTFDRDLRDLPMGLDTILPTGGGVFSGGQRQRLLLTRSIINKPKMLILDEATSSLDNQTQNEVQNNLQSLKTTRIIVAHRLSTIQHADNIYVIENGRNVAQGTFDELAKQPGIFSRLLEAQKVL